MGWQSTVEQPLACDDGLRVAEDRGAAEHKAGVQGEHRRQQRCCAKGTADGEADSSKRCHREQCAHVEATRALHIHEEEVGGLHEPLGGLEQASQQAIR